MSHGFPIRLMQTLNSMRFFLEREALILVNCSVNYRNALLDTTNI